MPETVGVDLSIARTTPEQVDKEGKEKEKEKQKVKKERNGPEEPVCDDK